MLFCDIETYSETDLKKSGVYRYVEDPAFEILMAAWSVDGKNIQLAVGLEEITSIPGLWDPNVTKVAHNAQFERVCFSRLNSDSGFLHPEQWLDTQALAAEAGYPQSLEACARALGADPKDSAGTRLINLFCKPYRGNRVSPEDRPEEWEEFKAYCIQDVRTLIDVHERLPNWTQTEHDIFMADQRINDRGITVDMDLARAAVEAAEENRMIQELKVSGLTGVLNPGSTQQLQAWLQESGVKLPDLKAETVEKTLRGDLSDVQRRVLELRQELALSSASKFDAALRMTCEDGRFRGAFKFFGAHTGRWSGRGIQLQNLTRASVENEESEILDVKLGNGADSKTLKALVRPMLTGPFTVVDYSAIEARVIAWLAGEDWALEAFAAGRDIYVETAERMGGLTRFQGKIAVLALGFGGGINSLRVMGGDDLGTDDDLQVMVNQYRKANQKIVRFWNQVEKGFRQAPRRAGKLLVKRGELRKQGMDINMELPSGRSLVYRRVKWVVDNGRPSTADNRWSRMTFADPKGYRTDTYGGRLSENATQAVARDVLAEALVRLEKHGYQVVGHVHDEVIIEGEHDVETVVKVMCESPDWAEGLPLAAEGYTCARYRKD